MLWRSLLNILLGGVVNLLPVDMINGHEGARLPGASLLCGGGKARDVLPGVESFPHLLTVCGGGEEVTSRAEVLGRDHRYGASCLSGREDRGSILVCLMTVSASIS
jgi:hypothetical protein